MTTVHWLRDAAAQYKGVRGLTCIPRDTVYVFPDLSPGIEFTMRGVQFPVEIGFFDRNAVLIDYQTMPPGTGWARAPQGSMYAVEAEPQWFARQALQPGAKWDPLEEGRGKSNGWS